MERDAGKGDEAWSGWGLAKAEVAAGKVGKGEDDGRGADGEEESPKRRRFGRGSFGGRIRWMTEDDGRRRTGREEEAFGQVVGLDGCVGRWPSARHGLRADVRGMRSRAK